MFDNEEKLYGGVADLDTIRQSPRNFGEVAVVEDLVAAIDYLEAECMEQAKLLGMGSEREARLLAQVEEQKKRGDKFLAENDKLRSIIANSDLDCIYCGIPKNDMVRCPSGFPGCGRADDICIGECSGEKPAAQE